MGLNPEAVSEFCFIPCSPVRAKAVPAGAGWIHEVKWDGYRCQAHKAGSRVVIFSRNGHDFSERFPTIAQELRELPAKTAVLDGEIVARDVDGRPNFAGAHACSRQGGKGLACHPSAQGHRRLDPLDYGKR